MKTTPELLIKKMKGLVQELSLKVLEKMTNGEKVEADELKHLTEMKKHLKFAENIQKEMDKVNGVSSKTKATNFSPDMITKIKNLESSIGDIVRQMPTK